VVAYVASTEWSQWNVRSYNKESTTIDCGQIKDCQVVEVGVRDY